MVFQNVQKWFSKVIKFAYGLVANYLKGPKCCSSNDTMCVDGDPKCPNVRMVLVSNYPEVHMCWFQKIHMCIGIGRKIFKCS